MGVAAFIVEGRLILLMDDKYEDCTDGGAKYIDYSGVIFDYINDTTFLLNGKISISWNFYSLIVSLKS